MIILGILIPFAGTTLGAASVYFMRNGNPSDHVEKGLVGLCLRCHGGGIRVVTSDPGHEAFRGSGDVWRFCRLVAGFFCGILFLMFLDGHVPQLQFETEKPEGISGTLKKTTMLVLAVTLHNIPEGMAVGVMFAGLLMENSGITLAGAYALAIGIGIQNFPEGAIVSMPIHSEGISKNRSFLYGTLSGVVEPAAAVLTLLLYRLLAPILPYLLAFAAGAMMYVVVEELIPETAEGETLEYRNHRFCGRVCPDDDA